MAPANAYQKLLKKISANPDFPAFARTVQEVYRLVDDEFSSANELAAMILRDPALTNRMLRLANAAQYRHMGGPIQTVSRAVVLLGFDEVRSSALALSLFEHIKSKRYGQLLQSRFLQALHQAFLAQNLANQLGGLSPEEMFLCALFQDFGALLVYRHAQDELADIQRMMHGEGLSEETAIQKVIGVLPVALARDVCEQWGMPETSRRFLTTHHQEGKISRLDPAARALRLAQVAKDCSSVIATADSYEQMQEQMAELAREAGLDRKQLEKATKGARDRIVEYRVLLAKEHGTPAFLARVGLKGDQPVPKDFEEPPKLERSELLVKSIQDITQLLTGEYELGEVFLSILEGMHQGLDLDLSVLFMLNRKQWQLHPRMGFGKEYASLRDYMNVSLHEASRIAEIFQTGDDRQIVRPSMPSDSILDWQFRQQADCAMLYPIYINRAPLGLFYLEGRQAVFHSENATALRTLRNQAALAIKAKTTR
ncbi:MAG: HDOD domain-containing protein [Halothiobacillaceae bacterium]